MTTATKTAFNAEAFTQALEMARKAATAADPGPGLENDGGTCNLDSVVVRFPRGTRHDKIRKLLGDDQASALTGWPFKGFWFIHVGALGQANRRSKMTEAAYHYLKGRSEELGVDVSMYCQMD